MKALINPIQDDIVAQVEEIDFEVAAPLFWVACDDTIKAYEYKYKQNVFVPYSPPPPSADENKQTAIGLLQQTDWTTIADVANPEMSNPYLANQAEFIAWRSQVRAIAVNPIEGYLDIFTQMPAEVWTTT